MPICNACGQCCDESEFKPANARCRNPSKTCNSCIRIANAARNREYRQRNKLIINARLKDRRATQAAKQGGV